MRSKHFFAAFVLLAGVFIVGYFLFTQKASAPITVPESGKKTEASSSSVSTSPDPQAQSMSAVTSLQPAEEVLEGRYSGEQEAMEGDVMVFEIIYNGQVFIPSSVKVKVGDVIIFKDQSSSGFDLVAQKGKVSSITPQWYAPDPVSEKGEFQYTFDRHGVWYYMDGRNSSATGFVEVAK